jgi:hypothetical protein
VVFVGLGVIYDGAGLLLGLIREGGEEEGESENYDFCFHKGPLFIIHFLIVLLLLAILLLLLELMTFLYLLIVIVPTNIFLFPYLKNQT